ncbi:N-acetylglutamate kinase [Ferrithrix thermotolerans DSM 19514]|uniref:Acetylglutamate kinase n=1 Tax=Ferrithrix thermotolerans DSM 19514 TaxID=1121881 RepID=A0A1M4S651_9ACTN|nr:acetylglutamate kinase [Ferrithrix thermotolerans]SHE27650.1 N-acetylglutamate kinase [Ferrithrix thermotolerans DSM 19514]
MTAAQADIEELSIKAHTLTEALPYIKRFWGKTVVIKYGGNAVSDEPKSLDTFVEDVVLLNFVGIRVVVVHGGGPQIDALLSRLGHASSFVRGLRVTDAETLESVKMVLLGQMNPLLVSRINLHGALGVGVSGADGSMVLCRAISEEHGYVGKVVRVDPSLLENLLQMGRIPVVASIGVDEEAQLYNVNADLVASELAGALKAEKLVFLTNVEGIRGDASDPSTLIRQMKADELKEMLQDNSISGGMIPKANSALLAIERGVASVHLLDGRLPHALLLEVFTDHGIGTMLYA